MSETAVNGVEPIIFLDDVHVTFRTRTGSILHPNLVHAVQGVTIKLMPGQTIGIVGESGCGKSTTANVMCGLQAPTSGKVYFKGKDVTKRTAEDRRHMGRVISVVFQNPANQFVTQNVEDEVCVGLRLWEPGLSDEACRQRAEELLDRYGLKRQRRYSPYMLSQGQQRRLAVLSVLAGGQELLLLDEPTYGQDARSVNAIMEHLREKVEQEGALTPPYLGKVYFRSRLRGKG